MKHIVVVLTEPTQGRDAEYNEYYETLHLDEVLATTDWSSAQRFKLSAEQGMACPLPYLAYYEVEADNAESVLENLNTHTPAVLRLSASLCTRCERVAFRFSSTLSALSASTS